MRRLPSRRKTAIAIWSEIDGRRNPSSDRSILLLLLGSTEMRPKLRDHLFVRTHTFHGVVLGWWLPNFSPEFNLGSTRAYTNTSSACFAQAPRHYFFLRWFSAPWCLSVSAFGYDLVLDFGFLGQRFQSHSRITKFRFEFGSSSVQIFTGSVRIRITHLNNF